MKRLVLADSSIHRVGIPRRNAGVGLDYSEFEFYDQKVSSAVQFVYQALSLHERSWTLKPCFVYPGDGECKSVVRQKWFAGIHHDLGRSTFRYLRRRPWNSVERLLGIIPSFLTKEEWPNEVCADVVARWLLQGIKDTEFPNDPNLTFPGIDHEVRRLGLRISLPRPRTLGTGDTSSALSAAISSTSVSSNPDVLLDAIKRLVSLPFTFLNYFFPRFGSNTTDWLGLSALIGIVTATTDRRIPRATEQEDVYPYLDEESVFDDLGRERRFTVSEKAVLQRAQGRYVGRTYETFLTRRRVFGW